MMESCVDVFIIFLVNHFRYTSSLDTAMLRSSWVIFEDKSLGSVQFSVCIVGLRWNHHHTIATELED